MHDPKFWLYQSSPSKYNVQVLFPGISPTVGTVEASVKDEKVQTVRLKCVWNYKGDTKNVEFHVRWFGDENKTKHNIEKMFVGNANREFVFHFAWDVDTGKKNNTGYELGKQV